MRSLLGPPPRAGRRAALLGRGRRPRPRPLRCAVPSARPRGRGGTR